MATFTTYHKHMYVPFSPGYLRPYFAKISLITVHAGKPVYYNTQR